jgi:hypothetical protein
MAKANNTVNAAKMEAIVAFVRKFNDKENRGCPAGAIEYVGGFSKAEIKAAKASGKLESGKGSEGGFFVAGNKPVAKGPVVKATVKNQMAAFMRMLTVGYTMTDLDIDQAKRILRDYDAQNAKRRKSDD